MIQFYNDLTRNEWLSARANDVTSTEIAALFGLSPYTTAFELWHHKKNQITVALEPTDRIKWGSRLEASIAAGIAEDNGWQIARMPSYVRDTEKRLGASFDFGIGTDGLLEIKNVDSLQFREKWLVDGDTIEAPASIELQVQLQLMLSGRKYAYIGALIGGNRVVLIKREPQPSIQASITAKAAEFWASIEEGNSPPPLFPDDAVFVASLHAYAEPGTVMAATPAIAMMAAQYQLVLEEQKVLEASKSTIKARILMEIGAAEKCVGDGFSISAGVIGPARVEAYDRAGYRSFRVTHKKVKQ